MLGNILLGIVSLCTMISYLPQTIKLIKTKKSNDLSINSWILWVISSLSYTLYAFICSKDFMLIFETSLELFFCLLILLLAIKYKNNK
jgi:MtN3 and saliva related transmembrane protein